MRIIVDLIAERIYFFTANRLEEFKNGSGGENSVDKNFFGQIRIFLHKGNSNLRAQKNFVEVQISNHKRTSKTHGEFSFFLVLNRQEVGKASHVQNFADVFADIFNFH